MVKRIVHISLCNNYSGLNKILYIPECVRAGLDVKYLNLAKLVGGEVQGLSSKDCIEINVSTLSEFDELLLKFQGDTLFNVQIGYEHRWENIFNIIRKRCSLTSIFAVGKFPKPDADMVINFKRIASLYRKLWSKLFESNDGFYPDYVFAAGKVAAYPFLGKSKIVKIELREFEEIVGKSFIDLPEKYMVFVDQYIPFHPDRILTGITAIDGELYYKSLLMFFSDLEKATGMEVVVAAHPKSNYPPNFFGGRKSLTNSTEELISKSSLVLSHFSTAVCHAVKYTKPLIFITSTSETGLDIERYVMPFARYFNAPCYQLGSRVGRFTAYEIDATKYDNYKFDFLTWENPKEIVFSKTFPRYVRKLA